MVLMFVLKDDELFIFPGRLAVFENAKKVGQPCLKCTDALREKGLATEYLGNILPVPSDVSEGTIIKNGSIGLGLSRDSFFLIVILPVF